MAIYVNNPQGALGLPVGEVHLKFTDGSYYCIMFTDVFDDDTARMIDKYVKDNHISVNSCSPDDLLTVIFVDPTKNIYWEVYPIFCPYRFDYSYIKDEVKKQKGRRKSYNTRQCA